MTYPTELQEYYDAHERMMREEHSATGPGNGFWALRYGIYKVARYNAVKAGYLPETPEFG